MEQQTPGCALRSTPFFPHDGADLTDRCLSRGGLPSTPLGIFSATRTLRRILLLFLPFGAFHAARSDARPLSALVCLDASDALGDGLGLEAAFKLRGRPKCLREVSRSVQVGIPEPKRNDSTSPLRDFKILERYSLAVEARLADKIRAQLSGQLLLNPSCEGSGRRRNVCDSTMLYTSGPRAAVTSSSVSGVCRALRPRTLMRCAACFTTLYLCVYECV